MAMISAGLLVWRPGPEFLLAHMGGPYWARKDAGAWTIPKGVVEPGEEPLAAARREFFEETGLGVEGRFEELTAVRQSGGKLVRCWLVRSDPPLEGFVSNSFEMEWPPKSGRRWSFPEIDRVAWFAPSEAAEKVLQGQRPLIAEAAARLR